ncbi:MAG: flagellar basal-body rod protein FlgB [Alicyclobacillus sp. RIFOXYA1_FULL_53_8]|nr:MAG: flagellar basal-body rod protein FlgB [Alicyclobacillus sp. RIFOXYA1_FULL_53_8]
MTSDVAAFGFVDAAMKASELRQQVYANNIANIDTPGYKRQDVNFESILQQTLSNAGVSAQGTGAVANSSTPAIWQALANVQPQIVTDTSTTVNNNGNNVDANAEMAKLAENQLRYNGLVQDLQLRLHRMQAAISG